MLLVFCGQAVAGTVLDCCTQMQQAQTMPMDDHHHHVDIGMDMDMGMDINMRMNMSMAAMHPDNDDCAHLCDYCVVSGAVVIAATALDAHTITPAPRSFHYRSLLASSGTDILFRPPITA
jgi:hypothetical protein